MLALNGVGTMCINVILFLLNIIEYYIILKHLVFGYLKIC